MSDFKPFSKVIKANFDKMSKKELYRVDVTGDDVLQCRNIYPLEVIECKYDYEKNQLKIITKPVGNIDSVFYKIV